MKRVRRIALSPRKWWLPQLDPGSCSTKLNKRKHLPPCHFSRQKVLSSTLCQLWWPTSGCERNSIAAPVTCIWGCRMPQRPLHLCFDQRQSDHGIPTNPHAACHTRFGNTTHTCSSLLLMTHSNSSFWKYNRQKKEARLFKGRVQIAYNQLSKEACYFTFFNLSFKHAQLTL